ncbi:MAG: methyltransferase, TIGR04325 family [Nibricoccus sp.]
MLKPIVRALCPPVVLSSIRRIFGQRYGWLGDYPSWSSAAAVSTGYDDGLILERVKEAAFRVRNGEAAFERDSVIFQEPQYNWPVLAGLLWSASRNGGRLNLMDFGGSLGSSYFQNRRFLSTLPFLRWNVVEQKHFVDCGKELFEDARLRFYYDVESCVSDAKPDTLLLSSVLQYLESSCELLDRLIAMKFRVVIIGDTPCWKGERDRITVQKVPPSIYSASYPSWVFREESLIDRMKGEYDLVGSFCNDVVYSDNVRLKSFILERRADK